MDRIRTILRCRCSCVKQVQRSSENSISKSTKCATSSFYMSNNFMTVASLWVEDGLPQA